jgi:hypothetical protein
MFQKLLTCEADSVSSQLAQHESARAVFVRVLCILHLSSRFVEGNGYTLGSDEQPSVGILQVSTCASHGLRARFSQQSVGSRFPRIVLEHNREQLVIHLLILPKPSQ